MRPSEKQLARLAQRKLYFVQLALKPDEADWLETEAERLGVAQSVIFRHAFERMRENPLDHLPRDFETVPRRKGVGKTVKIDFDMAVWLRGECFRLNAYKLELAREALVRLRAEGPLSIPRPTDRQMWWKGEAWPPRVRRRRRPGVVHRLLDALLGDR